MEASTRELADTAHMDQNSSQELFHWEHDNSDIPYYLQGNRRYETEIMR